MMSLAKGEASYFSKKIISDLDITFNFLCQGLKDVTGRPGTF